MGIKGTYFPLPTAYDTIESTYNSKINEAYYIIDNIKVNNIYQEDISDDMSGNEYTNLLIQLTVYNNHDERLNTTFETRNELEIIDFHLIIDKHQEEEAINVYDKIIDISSSLNGVYSAEHGTGKRKKIDFIKCYGNTAAEQIRTTKLFFDPNMLLNKGNVIS